MGLPKGCQCYLGPFGAKVLFFTSLIVILTTLHNLVVKPMLWRLLLPPAKLQLEHDETIYAMSLEKMQGIRASTNHSKAASFELTIVTAASSNFYPQLVNLIGSIHLWEAGLPILVYDLGLEPPQLRELSCLGKVSVKPFPFHKPITTTTSSSSSSSSTFSPSFLSHIRDLRTGAFKPFVIADALQSHPKLVFMDAGTELWSTLDNVVDALKKDGSFFVETLEKTTSTSAAGSAEELAERTRRVTDAVQGYVRHSTGCASVLDLLVKCELHLNCSRLEPTRPPTQGGIFPHLSSLGIRSKKILRRSFGAAVVKTGLAVKGKLYDFETVKHQKDLKLLFSRRSHCPKPHIRLINYGQCPVDFPADPRRLFERRNSAATPAANEGVGGDPSTTGNDAAADNHSHSQLVGVPDARRGVIFDAASFGADGQIILTSPFSGAGGVQQRRVIPCGAIMLGDTHVDTQTLFKFAFFAEAVVVSTLICALMRRYIIKNRHIVIREDDSAWTKIL